MQQHQVQSELPCFLIPDYSLLPEIWHLHHSSSCVLSGHDEGISSYLSFAMARIGSSFGYSGDRTMDSPRFHGLVVCGGLSLFGGKTARMIRA